MIKRNEENKNNKNNVFKKFSDFSKSKVGKETEDGNNNVPADNSLPMNPNLPNSSTKKVSTIVDNSIKPGNVSKLKDEDQEIKEQIELRGKVAKFPKDAKASKAFNFLESVKVSKNNIWYILIEKQNNELQMLKYNIQEGVDLNKFVTDLKIYYKEKYAKNEQLVALIENIVVDGNDKFSMIKNIPNISINQKKLITLLTQDLLVLLQK